ncbi:hypothetical protein KAT63_02150 [Candidatus Parcubacteria bacterium]|nr:hypothetical protein [Candidatus Parcubacteria bacterium]
MENENEIKDDFNKDEQEGSTQEYGANEGKTHPNPSQEGNNIQEYGSNENEADKQEGSTALRDNGANNIIPKKKMTLKKFLKMTVLFIVFLVAWFAVVQYMAADKYEAVVKVMEEGGKIGVNPMTERLDYGDLPKGNASTRFVTIENSGKMGIYVAIVKYGGIAELIKINKNNFVLNPGEKEKLEFLLEMPISADKEGYEGKVVIFKLPKLF